MNTCMNEHHLCFVVPARLHSMFRLMCLQFAVHPGDIDFTPLAQQNSSLCCLISCRKHLKTRDLDKYCSQFVSAVILWGHLGVWCSTDS